VSSKGRHPDGVPGGGAVIDATVERFFDMEGNAHVLAVLREAVRSLAPTGTASFTFNVFDVGGGGVVGVRIEDVLNPEEWAEVPIKAFAEQLAFEELVRSGGSRKSGARRAARSSRANCERSSTG
jgi:hypothetical protein